MRPCRGLRPCACGIRLPLTGKQPATAMLRACLVTARPRLTPTPLPAQPARATAAAATRPTSLGCALRPGRRHSPPTPDQAVSGPTSTSTCPGQSGAWGRSTTEPDQVVQHPPAALRPPLPDSRCGRRGPLPRPQPPDDLTESDDGAASFVGGVPEPAPRGAHGRARVRRQTGPARAAVTQRPLSAAESRPGEGGRWGAAGIRSGAQHARYFALKNSLG